MCGWCKGVHAYLPICSEHPPSQLPPTPDLQVGQYSRGHLGGYNVHLHATFRHALGVNARKTECLCAQWLNLCGREGEETQSDLRLAHWQVAPPHEPT